MTSHSPRPLARGCLIALLTMLAISLSACSLFAAPDAPQALYSGPPVVSIAAPQPNDTYQAGVGVNILVRVENAGPDIARVAIALDGQIIGEAPLPNTSGAPSFTVRNGWTAQLPGSHTISVSASRADGTASNPVSVTINVVAAPQSQPPTANPALNPTTPPTQPPTVVQPTAAPANTQPPTQNSEPTDPPPPTNTNTPAVPQVRVVTGANIRRGPSTAFEPPIGSLAAGATTEVLAVTPDGAWYKVRYYNGEGWIFGVTVEVIGDISSLPKDAGPATPIPFTPTPVATATAVAVADLSIVSSSTSPFPFECGEDSEIRVTVRNSGTGNSGDTRMVVEDIYKGQVQASTEAPIRALAPGENTTGTMYLKVTTYVQEGHTSRVRIDPDNRVAETNENNNTDQDDYVLASGDC